MNINFKSQINSKDWQQANLFTPNPAVFGIWYNLETLQILRYTPDEYIIFTCSTLDDFKKELKISAHLGLLLKICIDKGNPLNAKPHRSLFFKSDLDQECVRLLGKSLQQIIEEEWGQLTQSKLDEIWRMLHQAYHAYCINRSAYWEVEPEQYILRFMPANYDPARLTSWGAK